MRLGLGLGYAGPRVQVDVQAVQDAERLGYHSVWTAEAYGSDAVVPLAWVGAMTYRIRLGTAIMQMAARTPAMTAMTAMTLDALSGGRRRGKDRQHRNRQQRPREALESGGHGLLLRKKKRSPLLPPHAPGRRLGLALRCARAIPDSPRGA